jgi:branched-subunit amino acid transport protein
MEARAEVLLLIAACLLVTIIPRVLPLLLAHRLRLPPLAKAWLKCIPAAVISALFFKEIMLADGKLALLSAPFIAGVTALAAAFISRSIALTIVIGVAAFATLSQFGL